MKILTNVAAKPSPSSLSCAANGSGKIVRIARTTITQLTDALKGTTKEKTIRRRDLTHIAVKTGERLVFLRATDSLPLIALCREQDEITYSALKADNSGELELTSLKNSTLTDLASAFLSHDEPNSNATIIRHERSLSSYEVRHRGQWSYSDETTSKGDECHNHLAVACHKTGELLAIKASESTAANLMHAITEDRLFLPPNIDDLQSIQLVI